jgi:hypothetical protein
LSMSRPAEKRSDDEDVEARVSELTIVLDATENVVDIVGEEATGVKHRLDQAGYRAKRHVLAVGVLVPLGSRICASEKC